MQLACKIGATWSEYVTFSSAAYPGCVITIMPTTTAASAEIRGWSFISDVSLIGKRSPAPSLGGTLEPRTDAQPLACDCPRHVVNQFCSRIIEEELLRAQAEPNGR